MNQTLEKIADMPVNLSKYAGFCPGVRNADKTVTELIQKRCKNERIFTLGELIHNEIYNLRLCKSGVGVISVDECEGEFLKSPSTPMSVIIRTHGIAKDDEESLLSLAYKYPEFRVIDATCPYVKKIHNIAKSNTSDNTYFLLYCDPNHPEAIGIMSHAKGDKLAFSSLDEIKGLDFSSKTPILCSQTTQNLVEFKKIKIFLEKLYTNAIFFDTICSVTEKRQCEAIQIAKSSDRMIVIGGKASSNTRKLYELCKIECPETYIIQSVDDLPDAFADDKKLTGITAGASTPDSVITEVINKMENFNELLEGSIKSLHTGDTVVGTVVTIGENEIKLDLGAKFTGVLPREQITDDPAVKLAEMFKVDDQIKVFVIRVEDGKGLATVSKKRVDKDNSWVVLKDAFDNGEILEGKVATAVKGGVLVAVAGNNVFVPASQTGIARDGDVSVLVGTTQKIKLLEFDTDKKKALGSIKVVLAEEKKAREDAIWATLEVGAHYTGTVKNLTPYGAFVDIGGVDGMVHNTELSWKRIKHPSQVVSVGQQIEVFIKELDDEKRRISLGYKTQEMDTWFQFTQKFAVGDIVTAKIVSIMPFGAFARVYEDVDGLIHISRISTERINSPADVLTVGQEVDVKITEIDDENRKLALSIKAITEAAEKAAREEAKAAQKAAREAEEAEAAAKEAEERADMAPYIVGSID